jgi:excisionase family DNA binding protein
MATTSTNGVRLLTVADAAGRLGLSIKTLRGWVWRRAIPYHKIGRCVRISDEVVQHLIDCGRMPPRGIRE